MAQILYIITGSYQSGKTCWLNKAVDYLIQNNRTVFGVLAPGIWNNKKKIGIDNILLPGLEKFNIAKIKPFKLNDDSYKWKFYEDVLDGVNEYFKKFAFEEYFIVDELGPLEFVQNKGLTNALDIIKNVKYNKAIVVIRPSFIKYAQITFKKCRDIRIIDISHKPKFDFLL